MSKSKKPAGKTSVYLNGRFVGNHPDGKNLANRLRERRRINELNYQVNIYYNKKLNELHIISDKGRVRRPYIVVENGKSRLTPEILKRVEKNELGWHHLVKMGIIEYLDAQEEENSLIAAKEDEVSDEHTHLEVDSSNIFGIVASVLPYPEHNSSPRITMACAMAKQSLGIYATNFGSRYDTRAYAMYCPQEPIVRTNVYNALNLREKSAGQNCVVALIGYHGYNMADAIVINRSAIDRGLSRVAMFKTYETEERLYPGGQKDTIELPTPDVVGYRGEESYSHLDEDGIVIPESKVSGREVLVGKTSPPRFLEEISVFGAIEEKKRESSLALKSGEEGKIDSVLITEGPSGNRLVKVRVRGVKIPEVGDKLASRHGQKGVIGLLVPHENMPFTKNGVTPDLIVNPHAIPSRMTAGHLLEMLGGKAGSVTGTFKNATAFSGDREEKFREELEKAGFNEYGEEVLYDGATGKMIKAKIFIGVIYYQRLHHLVSNKMHVRSRGPVQLLTHQPTEGRAREGGLRFGEMERDCLIGYGASMLIKERMLEESDKTIQLVCTECGSTATHDHARNRDVCPVCGSENVEPVEMSYAFKLLLDEIKSLYIFPRLLLKKKGE